MKCKDIEITLINEIETAKGHLKLQRQHVQSTQGDKPQ